MTLKDRSQRRQATDPTQSFIVQAPAGSGKTELLTQRYLRLLGTVKEPEQIVALTFTRKAANEMRERILKSLQLAASDFKATSAHQQETLELAKLALVRDKKNNWHILNQPSRLRIITIDALCQMIANAIPLQEQQIPYAKITDKPLTHYQNTAQACLTFAIEHQDFQEPITTLLRHLDNRQNTLLELFTQLLATRTQWLQPIFKARAQEKADFEQALSIIEEHELTRFKNSIPKDIAEKLVAISRTVALIEADPESARFPLSDWHSFPQLNRKFATSLASLLLTSQNTLRKSFDHHVGLKKEYCNPGQYEQIKESSKLILENLSQSPDFLEALLRVKELPDPHYNQEQWEVLQSLFCLLPLLLAHLNVTFSTNNEVDFTAVSQQALEALGDDENPTDLALYMDNRIQHLLVDEFQDTSIQQYELLEKIIQGWQPRDGRTLFVVGDPMQSIYRFRSAEVGLFIRAQQSGIGSVSLVPLELSCNFRSTKTIVNWVNEQFKYIFPAADDIESGAVSFHQSEHTQSEEENTFVQALQFQTSEHQAMAIADIAYKELNDHPDATVAILVRSRSQLTEIIEVLREREIPFQGVEIDLLAHLPHLRDVWSLTKALIMPANRLSWLSFLRSPWCGISLKDLHQIANFAPKKSILFALSQLDKISNVSDDGRLRVKFIASALKQALANRYQLSLVDWLITTLNQLHLNYVLDAKEQDDLEQYWKLLERFEKAGQLNNLDQFKDEFNKLYSQQVTPSNLQIMTIHKSKGLEFDCVILPGLNKKSPTADKPLMRWLKIPQQTQGELMLLSPVKAAHQDHCKVYDFLGKLDEQKSNYETQRLLYVAITRAKKRLFLTDHGDTNNKNTFRSLIHKQEFIDHNSDTDIDESSSLITLPKLFLLPTEFYKNNIEQRSQRTTPSTNILTDHSARQIGIITHELLQWICTYHPAIIDEVPWALAENHMRAIGMSGGRANIALQQIKKWIQAIYTDEVGKWIIEQHDNEINEYEILIKENNEIHTRIIDRTFIAKNFRWIIDFKTGFEDEKTIAKHKKQLDEYAKQLKIIFSQPISCGLYFLQTNNWVEWEFN